MNQNHLNFHYGSKQISYLVQYSPRRTLEIAVLPDMQVVLTAPLHADLNKIKEKVHKRRRWILRQIKYFEQFQPRANNRRYISGESHLYLGKQYRLKVIHDKLNTVYFQNGQIVISCEESSQSSHKKLLTEWYLKKAKLHFAAILADHVGKFSRMGYREPNLVIRKMDKRWGSMSSKGTLTLNLSLIKAPRLSIEYVIIHELCHLKFPHHNKQFFNYLEKMLPDWQKRKNTLEIKLS